MFRSQNKIRSLLVALMVAVSGMAIAPRASLAQNGAALPKGVTKLTSVEGITEYRLENGLHVLLFPDQSKQTMTVNVTYEVGSKYESYGETGMAHLLEHMLFKGSPKHTNIPDELSSHGARPNGSTWYDRTNYYETFAASDENLKWALDLESDRMVNSFVAKKDLDSEMTVVRNEYEMGENSPGSILVERVFSTAYLWHNYGKSTIGARSDIENVPIERLQAFYKRYYQPDNAVLLIAGKIDEAKTLELINQYFSPIPRPSRVLPQIYTAEPTQDGERQVTLRRVGDVQVVMAGYHVPAGSHPDAPAVKVLSDILADDTSGRLHKALVETKKASSVDTFSTLFGEPSLLIFGAEVRQESSLDDARNTLLDTVENISKTPPTKEEVARARDEQLKQIELNLNSSENVGLELSEWIGMGDWRLLFVNRDRLRKVTPEDVARVASAYLKQSNRTLGVFVPTAKPDRAEIPATPDIASMVKDYKGDAVVATGEAFDPSPANIEARTMRSTVGGLKMALLTKKTRGNTVVATITLRFGDEKSLMNRGTAGDLAGEMLMRGTAKHTRQQIKDEFDRLKARVQIGGGTTSAIARIETTRENLPAVLTLVAEVLREPSFPANEFEQLKQEELAGIEQQRSEPTSVGGVEFQRHMRPYPKGHPNYVSTPDEDIADLKAATLDDVKKFYADFYGASNGEVAVVGDFDDKAVAKEVGDLFGNWKSPHGYTRIVTKYEDVAPINKALETPDKANAFFLAGLNLNIRDDDPDYPALALGTYILGGSTLSSRLGIRIRQKDGLSYGVGSQLQVGSLDKNGIFATFAIYAPQNEERLEADFKDEVARALKDGFTEEEVQAAKSGWSQARQLSRAQDPELLGKLSSYLFYDRTLAWDADYEKKVMALTPDQIVAAMRRYIDPTKITIVKAGDFSKAKAAAATK